MAPPDLSPLELLFPVFAMGTLVTALVSFGLLARDRRVSRVFWGVFVLLVVALVSVAFDTSVLVVGGILGRERLAMQFSRLHELTMATFLTVIPYFFWTLVPPRSRLARVCAANAVVSAVIVLAIVAIAFVRPDLFVSVTRPLRDANRIAYSSAAGRGATGAVFAFRDAILAVQIVFALVAAIIIARRGAVSLPDRLIVAGVAIGVMMGGSAIYSNFVGHYPGPMDGVPIPRVGLALTLFALLATTSHVLRFVGQSRLLDQTNRELQHRRDRLAFLAYHDEMTQMFNKQALLEDIGGLLTRTRDSDRDHPLAATVILCDLDGFRSIVDSYGFGFSDRLLRIVGRRLENYAGRHGGSEARAYHVDADQFAVLLPRIRDGVSVGFVEDNLLTTVAQPLHLDGQEVYLSASAGVYTVTGNAVDAEDVLRRLKRALSEARETHNTVCRYSADVHVAVESTQALVQDLRRAVRRNEFSVVYQPIVDREGTIAAAEALLRWNDAGPAEFIPLAEESGLIVPMTGILIDRVFQDLPALLDLRPELTVYLNVSARHISQLRLREEIDRRLENGRHPPSAVGIEITETSFLHGGAEISSLLADIRGRGMSVAIDDFGTGYSTLSYLKNVPADRIKIDQSFIRGLPLSLADAALVESVITIGRRLGKTVVAEGVETRDQHRYLLAQGVDYFQGFFFSAGCSLDDPVWSRVGTMELER